MDYFILKVRYIVKGDEGKEYENYTYYCAQNITRNVYAATSSDKTAFLCSGVLTVVDTKDVVGAFPQTPPNDWE